MGTKYDETINELVIKLTNVVNKMNKIPRDYGLGYPLYKSEIHMINFIGNNPDVNVTTIAEAYSISKSAVSQTLSKLFKKNLITKKRYKKDIIVNLTHEGIKAYKGHIAYHDSIKYKSSFENTEKYTEEDRLKFIEFMSDYINDLPKD